MVIGDTTVGNARARWDTLTDSSIYCTDSSRGDELPNHDAQREVPRPDSLHEEQLLGPCLFNELLGLGDGDCERLLAQDIFTSFKGQHRILEMVAVRSSDVNDVHIRISDELRVRAISFGTGWTINLLNKAGGPVGRAGRGYRYNLMFDIGGLTSCWVGQEVLAEG